MKLESEHIKVSFPGDAPSPRYRPTHGAVTPPHFTNGVLSSVGNPIYFFDRMFQILQVDTPEWWRLGGLKVAHWCSVVVGWVLAGWRL